MSDTKVGIRLLPYLYIVISSASAAAMDVDGNLLEGIKIPVVGTIAESWK